MTKNNPGRRFPLSGSGEALFWLSFFPDEIGAGPGLKFDLFLLKHVLMSWTVVAIAMGVGMTGRGLPPHLAQRTAHSSPHPARPPASSPAPWGGGSHGDTQGKAVPRIAINREHPDEISTKFGISCFVRHYPPALIDEPPGLTPRVPLPAPAGLPSTSPSIQGSH